MERPAVIKKFVKFHMSRSRQTYQPTEQRYGFTEVTRNGILS